jgi:hypothetical protein
MFVWTGCFVLLVAQLKMDFELHLSIVHIYSAAQPFQGRYGMTLGSLMPGSMEDKRFQGCFGCSAFAARKAWFQILPVLEPNHPQSTSLY